MINRPKAIKDFENLCFKCLQKQNNINKYFLHRSNYGSSFDNNYTHLQLCDECKKEINEEWFKEEPEIIDGYCADYKYEKDIINFIDNLPLEGQELFWGRCAHGACADHMSGQDWIDRELDILPEWKYKQYSYYVPYRMKVAKERFVLCNEPVNVVYSDSSKGCWCPFGSHGEYEQKVRAGDRPYKCYNCDQFHKRYESIKEMTDKEYKKYEQIRKAKVLLEKEPELNEM